MKPLFDLNIPGYYFLTWSDHLPDRPKGLIVPNAEIARIKGGFGEMLFQRKRGIAFDAWWNEYAISKDCVAQGRLDYRSIEFTLIRHPLFFRQQPFKGRIARQYEINLAHTLAMDNTVHFAKDTRVQSFDLHFNVQSVECLMDDIPDLVEPFLNDYYAGRAVQLFPVSVFPNEQILEACQQVSRSILYRYGNEWLTGAWGIVLLTHLFLYKATLMQRRGLTSRQERVVAVIQQIMADLMLIEGEFKGIRCYADRFGYSESYLRRCFERLTGCNMYAFLLKHKLDFAHELLRSTDASIKEISAEVGFQNLSGFYKAFKRQFTSSPKQVREPGI